MHKQIETSCCSQFLRLLHTFVCIQSRVAIRIKALIQAWVALMKPSCNEKKTTAAMQFKCVRIVNRDIWSTYAVSQSHSFFGMENVLSGLLINELLCVKYANRKKRTNETKVEKNSVLYWNCFNWINIDFLRSFITMSHIISQLDLPLCWQINFSHRIHSNDKSFSFPDYLPQLCSNLQLMFPQSTFISQSVSANS